MKVGSAWPADYFRDKCRLIAGEMRKATMTAGLRTNPEPRTNKRSSRVRLLFFGDHFSREIEIAKRSLASLDAELQAQCDAYIMPQDVYGTADNISFAQIVRLRPDLIVCPAIKAAQAWLLPLAWVMGSRIIVQHSEQFLINAARRYKFASISSLRLRNVAHLSWTETHKKELVANAAPAEQIFVSGSPKLAPLADLPTMESADGLPVGFVSNFSLADMPMARLERLKIKFGVVSDYAINSRLKTLRGRFIRVIARSARAFPDKQFVVRAHPGESFTAYEAMLGAYANVSFSRDEPFSDFLDGIGAAVLHDSTSIFEIAHRHLPLISINLGHVNDDWVQQPSGLFKGSRPRDVMRFVEDPEAFSYRPPKPGLLQEILEQMESYDQRIGWIYHKILSDDAFLQTWRTVPLPGYLSFLRYLLIQYLDQVSEKLGIDMISTKRRNATKSERYGRTLEVTDVAP